MRRRLALSLLAVMATVLFVVSGAGAQLASEDSVTGIAGIGGIPFTFDAHSGPSGEDPRGSIDLVGEDGTVLISAPVICLTADGRRATIRVDVQGVVETVFFVEDNDGTGSDRFNTVTDGSIPSGCPVDPPAGLTLHPVVSGDLEVVDAQPFPTSKDQCKNGGWRNYGATFKNQGDCVSFVATGGKNPPAG